MRRRTAIIISILIFSTSFVVVLYLQRQTPTAQEGIQDVEFWAYQIQGLEEDGAVEALIESKYDLLVLEPTRSDRDATDFDTAGMVRRLHDSSGANLDSKLVIAYVDIGQAEDWRWYWNGSWVAPTESERGTPEFLVSIDPDGWEGNYPVAFWYDEWKEIILYGNNSSIQQVLDDGFDGIYMDWIEAYDYGPVVDVATEEGINAQQEMIDFIGEIRQYCRARNAEFLIIAQNALSIYEGHEEYFDRIDAVAQEHILFDGIADTPWGEQGSGDIRIPSNESDGYSTEWYTERLDLYLSRGKTVFVVDYATSSENVAESYVYAKAHGYVGFVTQIALSRLPTITPPDYPALRNIPLMYALVANRLFIPKA